MEEIEIRCPVGPRRLFLKMLADGRKLTITDGNLIELACSDCKKLLRVEHGILCSRVLHRYDLAGDLVESVIMDRVYTAKKPQR